MRGPDGLLPSLGSWLTECLFSDHKPRFSYAPAISVGVEEAAKEVELLEAEGPAAHEKSVSASEQRLGLSQGYRAALRR